MISLALSDRVRAWRHSLAFSCACTQTVNIGCVRIALPPGRQGMPCPCGAATCVPPSTCPNWVPQMPPPHKSSKW
jgi:hypothetical protein